MGLARAQHQREWMQEGFKQIDKRFAQVPPHFDQVHQEIMGLHHEIKRLIRREGHFSGDSQPGSRRIKVGLLTGRIPTSSRTEWPNSVYNQPLRLKTQ